MKKIIGLFLLAVVFVLGFKAVNVNAEEVQIDDEIVEENEVKKGYLEENWTTILASFLGTSTGMTLLFFVISKIFKKLTSTTKQSDVNVKSIEYMVNEVAKQTSQIDEIYKKINELKENVGNNLKSVGNNLDILSKEMENEIKNYRESQEKRTDFLINTLKVAFLNDKRIISSGVAKELEKRITEYEEKQSE